MGVKIGDAERQECLTYLQEELKLKAFQDKEAELYNAAFSTYGGLMTTDKVAAEEMCKAAGQLEESANEIIERREGMVSIPEVASAVYLKWHIAYWDYSAWATAQRAEIQALAGGMIPNSQRLKELLSQSEKSRSQAEKEQKKLIKRLRLGIDEVNRMLSNASAAIAAEDWEPRRRRREQETLKKDGDSSEYVSFGGRKYKMPLQTEELGELFEQISKSARQTFEVLQRHGKEAEYADDIHTKLVLKGVDSSTASAIVQNPKLLNQYLQMEADGIPLEEIALTLLKCL